MESIDTVVIGGGQAGLAAGYHLQRQGREFVILDARARTGDSWRERWDSLHLFTPARYCELDGMRFPGRRDAFVSKDQMADYLEAYAQKFQLPIRHGVPVERLSSDGGKFEISAAGREIRANNVVVAMSNYQSPRVPPFASQLSKDILSLHSQEYRNPGQLKAGPVLVVGFGNSGAEIAMDVAGTRPTILSGEPGFVIPWRIGTFVARNGIIHLLRFIAHHVLTVRTPIGRRMRDQGREAAPVVRVKPADLAAAGVERVSRITGVRDGLPLSEDGRVHEVANVIWCTGYRPGFAWIDLPILGEHGLPEHELGAVRAYPGLYFMGLPFTYSLSSAIVTGVSRDAKRIAAQIARTGEAPSTVTTRGSALAQPRQL